MAKMARLIKMHEIDEFSEVKTIPDGAVTSQIISNIRSLDEKSELEPFIRNIIFDPNSTPHGPTEIADIITTHVHIRGEKQLAAFILKGKSYNRVSSRIVAHQFAKARQIIGLNLMVFVAVGGIQDDAQRDFIQAAIDANSNYIIIDAHDLARLLISYEMICSKDGTPFDDKGRCRNGHILDEGLKLELSIKEKARYTIFNQKDISVRGAKRYSVVILLDPHYTKDTIRYIIKEATEKFKNSNYYRNERIRMRWGDSRAHVVWLFIACDSDDEKNRNWLCQSCWMDHSSKNIILPLQLNGTDKYEDIDILWNDNYKSMKEFMESITGTKEDVLGQIDSILHDMIGLANGCIENFNNYMAGYVSQEDFLLKMHEAEPKIRSLYLKAGNISLPPIDCSGYYQACQSFFANIDNMILFFSVRGLEIWDQPTRKNLMKTAIEEFYKNIKRIELEKDKIN
ncbi:MAG: hypothetical protein M0Q13_05300 [Methanothrix sp.]|jgi:hypothetical protein|nr:hypothetical protein [Methanothrix sp.]